MAGEKDDKPANQDEQPVKYTRSGVYLKARPGLILRDRRARRLTEKIRSFCPWLKDSDTPTVRAYAEMEVLTSQLYAALRHAGVLSPDQQGARRLLDDYRRMRTMQLAYAQALGLTPAARRALQDADHSEKSALRLVEDAEARIAALDSEKASERLPVPLNGTSDCDASEPAAV